MKAVQAKLSSYSEKDKSLKLPPPSHNLGFPVACQDPWTAARAQLINSIAVGENSFLLGNSNFSSATSPGLNDLVKTRFRPCKSTLLGLNGKQLRGLGHDTGCTTSIHFGPFH